MSARPGDTSGRGGEDGTAVAPAAGDSVDDDRQWLEAGLERRIAAVLDF